MLIMIIRVMMIVIIIKMTIMLIMIIRVMMIVIMKMTIMMIIPTSTAFTGYFPFAVSPDNITQSAPSNTALATSEPSARVGLGL